MYSEMAQTSQGLPKLIPDANNAAFSFNQWLCQFKVELVLLASRAGKTQGPNPVDVPQSLHFYLILLVLSSSISSEKVI